MGQKGPLPSKNSDIYYDWCSLNLTFQQFFLKFFFAGLLKVNADIEIYINM